MLINIFFILILLLIIVLIANAITFKHETYYKITGNSFLKQFLMLVNMENI